MLRSYNGDYAPVTWKQRQFDSVTEYQRRIKMHYTVCTPQFWDYSYTGIERTEPPEFGADCVEVEASNKRQAKVEAVRKMRKEGMSWVQDQDSDGASPFTGLEVFELLCPHGFCGCTELQCIQPNPEYLLLSECPECLKEWEEISEKLAQEDSLLVTN